MIEKQVKVRKLKLASSGLLHEILKNCQKNAEPIAKKKI